MIGKCVTCDHLNHALFGLPHLLSMPPLPELDVLKPWSNSFICASKRLPSLSRCGPWSIHKDGAANISRRDCSSSWALAPAVSP